MKTTLFIGLLLLLSISCKTDGDIKEAAIQIDPIPTLIDQLQGYYAGCIPSLQQVGSYSDIKVTINGNNIKREFRLSGYSDCSSPYYIYETEQEISQITLLSDSPLKLALDLEVISYRFTDLHGWYSTQNYCGLNDWAFNVAKDVTGLDCPGLKSGPSGTRYLSMGEIIYDSVILSSTGLSIVMVENESGLSDADRMVTDLREIPKSTIVLP